MFPDVVEFLKRTEKKHALCFRSSCPMLPGGGRVGHPLHLASKRLQYVTDMRQAQHHEVQILRSATTSEYVGEASGRQQIVLVRVCRRRISRNLLTISAFSPLSLAPR